MTLLSALLERNHIHVFPRRKLNDFGNLFGALFFFYRKPSRNIIGYSCLGADKALQQICHVVQIVRMRQRSESCQELQADLDLSSGTCIDEVADQVENCRSMRVNSFSFDLFGSEGHGNVNTILVKREPEFGCPARERQLFVS